MGYIFDPEVIAECVQTAVGRPLEEGMDALTQALATRYPGKIITRERDWILSNAGGAMGQITLLHSSLTEYLLIFGTPIGTEGHTGRYRTEVWDYVFEGELWCYREGSSEREVHKPGDVAYLGKSQAKGFKVPDSGYMVEYARGPIVSMMPFATLDIFTSTLDFATLRKTFRGYPRMIRRAVRHQLRR